VKRRGPGVAALALALALGACESSKVEPALVLPATPVLAMSIRWAVVEADGLRLRDKPDQTGRILLSLMEGARVELLRPTADAMEIDGQTDYWYLVNYNGIRGWTFGAFLTEVTGHAETDAGARQQAPSTTRATPVGP
jgi:hypothetical protein